MATAGKPNPNDALLAKLAELSARRDELAAQLLDPDVLADHHRVRDLSIRKAALDPIADGFAHYRKLTAQAEENRQLIAESGASDELAQMAKEELPELEREAEAILEKSLEHLVLADDRAIGSVMLELRAGVGGDEAGLWAGDLLKMYESYARERGWSFDTIDLDADEGLGGVRSAVVNIRGEGVWTNLAHEAGTHCVKRVPATESQGRVHTSTATVAVLPEPKDVDVTIDPSDVDEHITTAQGPGGQNVNKVATAVHLIHRPTGVEVRMQETKSQSTNREKAWRILRARVYEIELQRQRAEEAAARNEQIGTGGRAERIRTYRYKDNMAVDHRVNESFSLQQVLAGKLDEVVGALVERETARRLANL
ncbi:MAG: PCRF domain-containing protein [Phycisphaerales bacterium]